VTWRPPAREEHTIETLERISSALCAPPARPVAVCDAVVEAAAHLFGARWAAMVFSGEYPGVEMARVFVHAGDCVLSGVLVTAPISVRATRQGYSRWVCPTGSRSRRLTCRSW
jgi:hypothetical protein